MSAPAICPSGNAMAGLGPLVQRKVRLFRALRVLVFVRRSVWFSVFPIGHWIVSSSSQACAHTFTVCFSFVKPTCCGLFFDLQEKTQHVVCGSIL